VLRRYNRLLVACYVIADLFCAALAFLLAYFIRFESWFVELVPVTKTQPPFWQYLYSLPVIALLVPIAFQLQGLYRLRRGRTRVDDFFAVLVGSLLAVLAGVALSLYATAYISTLSEFHPISRAVWLLFLGLTVTLTYASREVVRDLLHRRWRAGIGLKHVLIVGSGSSWSASRTIRPPTPTPSVTGDCPSSALWPKLRRFARPSVSTRFTSPSRSTST
jgi:FlaA1/EpsC-like NDP-sugar epimerase